MRHTPDAPEGLSRAEEDEFYGEGGTYDYMDEHRNVDPQDEDDEPEEEVKLMHAEPPEKETTMASDYDPLEEISVNAAKVIRARLKESRESVVRAQDLVDGVRRAAVVADGTQEGLKTLSAKLGEAEEMYAKVFASITRTYGDDPDDPPVQSTTPENVVEAAEGT